MKKIIFTLRLLTSICLSAMVGSAVYSLTQDNTAALAISSAVLIGGAVVSYAYRNHGSLAFACATLANGKSVDCTVVPVSGLEVDLWLANRDDVNWDTSTFVSDRLISDLQMKSGKFLYQFEGFKNTNTSSITMTQGKYKPQYTHTLGMIIFDNSAATKEDIIEKLPKSNLIAIVRNKSKGTNSNQEYELLGREVGLTATGLEKKSDDPDAGGGWKVTFGPETGEFENNSGIIIWDTNQSTTQGKLEALTDTGS